MRRLLAALDVDFDQWKALTWALLKLDFRTSSVGSQPGQKLGAVSALLFQFAFYTLIGLAMAFFVMYARDLFQTGLVVFTMTMFIVGATVLLDHNSAIASPNDYGILGFRPISARTYFAVRLTNVIVYTTAVTTAAVWLPVSALLVRHGVAVGAAGLLGFYASSTATTLTILAGYAWLLRVIGPDTIKRALSYLQFAMSFTIYGGYLLASRLFSESLVSSLAVAKTPWLLLFPATWFAAYLELAAGKAGPMEIVPAAMSLVALAALMAGLGGRLSLDYSGHLGAMLSAAAAKRTSERRPRRPGGIGRWLPFQEGEARSVALLVRSQFRNDQQFKMGVLSILPMTLLYMFMGLREGGIGDPFEAAPHRSGFPLVTMAVMMFPPMLKMQVTRSTAFRASWIFFACPTDRMKLVRAAKNVLVVYFVLPYLVFLTAAFMYFVRNLAHVVVHMALLGLISHLVLQITVLLEPDLPFSLPMTKKGGRVTGVFGIMGGIVVLSLILQQFSPVLYGSLAATASTFGVLLIASISVDRLTRARVDQRTRALEFEG